jgi:23S rRNA (adenine2503-C2)-methyltransferase
MIDASPAPAAQDPAPQPATAAPTPLLSLSLADTEAHVAALGFAREHAARLRRCVLRGAAPEDEPRLPPRLLAALRRDLVWIASRVDHTAPAADGSEKLLVALSDGERIEAVRLPGGPAGTSSACVSSQVGCAVACRFCASGLDRVRRNLEAHELLEQVALLRARGPVRRLVLMGSGEPTHNLRAVAAALQVLRDEGELGYRHVIVSTVGPAAAIDRVAALGVPVTLALSLHAPTLALRAELVPTQRDADPAALLDAADRYAVATRRPYQVEYVLLAGVNDGPAEASALAALLAGRRAHVSAIRWNAVAGMPFGTPTAEAATSFVATLRAAGISATLRRTVGGEATAACGQLRAARRAATAS